MSKERACNIIIRSLMIADNNEMSRQQIESLLLTTRYASTAISHCIAYCNDANKYHSAKIVYKKNNKTVTHVRLANVIDFNIETGFRLTNDQKLARDAKIAEIATLLATVTEMSNESFVSDSDVKMSDCLIVDESAIVSMHDTVLMITDDSESTRHTNRVAATLAKHDMSMTDDSVVLLAANKSKRARKAA